MKTTTWFGTMYARIAGGWKTHGPGASKTPGGFDSIDGELYPHVSSELSLRLSAWFACLRLRAETIASLPIQIMDQKNNVIQDHDLYSVLRYSPNADMTGPEFWSQENFNCDQFGISVALIDRWSTGGIKQLTPYSSDRVQIRTDDDGNFIYLIEGEEYPQDRVLIGKSFSTNGYQGIPLLEAARMTLSGQTQSNDAATRNFKNALRVGGFFEREASAREWDKEKRDEFYARMANWARPENQNKWQPLPPGFKAVGGSQFRISGAEAEILASRHFGIDELCRFLGVPPPLIGHTDKASSWAASLENLNLFLLTYSINPTLVRKEARIAKQLFTAKDKARGLVVKFNSNGLMRGDMKSRMAYYETMQGKLGNITTNQVLDLENFPNIGPEGDVRRVMLNTGTTGSQEAGKDENQAN